MNYLKLFTKALFRHQQIIVGILVSVYIFRLHANHSFFVGDDFQVYKAWMDPTSLLSNNFTAIRDVSLDKWRPLNNFATSTLMGKFKNYSDWNLLGLILWIVLLSLMILIRQSWIQTNKIHVVAGVILITLSPTLWYVQNSVFVFLELGPIVAILAGLILLYRAMENNTKVSVLYSAIWTGTAGLFHERFYIASFVLALSCYLRSRKYPLYKSTHLYFFVIPLIWVYSMTVSLGANPLRGGGEIGFSNNIGTWVIRNLYVAFIEIFKISGQIIVFDSGIPSLFDYGVALLLFLCLCTVTFLIKKHLGFKGTELWLLMLGTAIPAGLVYERIEPRWLLAPTIFFCLLAWMFLDQAKPGSMRYLSIIATIALIYLTVTVQGKFEKFEKWKTDSQKIVNMALNSAPPEGEWHLSLQLLDGSETWRYWALDNGAVFSENIPNGPSSFNQYFEDCPSRCVILQVKEKEGELFIDSKVISKT